MSGRAASSIRPWASSSPGFAFVLSNVGAIVVLAMVLVNYLQAVVMLPLKPVMAAIISTVLRRQLSGLCASRRACRPS
jgi:APA family basic amino acid/polyamine antiporter